MGVKTFYEDMYGGQRSSAPKVPLLYRMLRRFELNRYDLTCQVVPGGISLLDVGCGDGELLVKLKNKYQQLWGIDIVKPRIDRVLKNFGNDSNIHVKVEDVNQQISFEDKSFDTIIVVSVLEHLFDPYHLVKEAHRLLRQGGTLIVQVPNVAYLPNRIRLLLGKLPITSKEVGWDGGHLHYFTRSSLKALFEQSGFTVRKITSSGIFARPRRIWGSLLAGDILVVGHKR